MSGVLDDPELRGCLPADRRIEERFLWLRFEPIEFEGQRYDQLAVEDLFGDYEFQNCFNAIIARSPQPAPTQDQLYFLLIDRSGQAGLGFREVSAAPRRPTAEPVALERLGGSLGGAGFRDGPASDARFDLPLGLAADLDGRLFVADAENRAIRRIDPDGDVTTWAEIPQFESVLIAGAERRVERQNLHQPVALAFDPQGKLHALDSLCGEIWRVDGGRLVRVYQRPANGFGTTADLSGPRAMVFDHDGTVLVADSGNHRIVRIDLERKSLSPVVGTYRARGHRDGGQPLFDLPEGLALDRAGRDLFVSEYGNNTIRQIDLASGKVRTLAGRRGKGGHADGRGASARFDAPSSLVYHDGELFVAESYGLVIRRIEVATGKVTTLAGKYGRAGASDGVGSAARFAHHESTAMGEMPYGLAIADGSLYLTDSGNHVVRRIAVATGQVSTIAGRSIDGDMPAARALARVQNRLYVTAGQALYRLDPSGSTLLAGHPSEMGYRDGVAKRARFRGPRALAGLSNGLLVVGEINGQVRLVDPASGKVKTLVDFERILNAITVDEKDAIYVASLFTISRIDADGKATVVVARDAKAHPDAIIVPTLHEPVAMALDGERLYLLDSHRIYKRFPGTLTTLRQVNLATGAAEPLATWFSPTSGADRLRPRGLAVAADKSLWLTHSTGALTRFDPTTRSERGVLVERPSTRGLALGRPPHVNRPSMPLLGADGELLFVDEGAVVRLTAARPSAP